VTIYSGHKRIQFKLAGLVHCILQGSALNSEYVSDLISCYELQICHSKVDSTRLLSINFRSICHALLLSVISHFHLLALDFGTV